MSMDRRRFSAFLAPTALFVGLALFGVSLLILGTTASEGNSTTLEPSRIVTANGTAIMEYPTSYYGYSRGHIDVNFTFPRAAGDAYLLSCDDAARLAAGEAPEAPLLAFKNLTSWRFTASDQTTDGPMAPFPPGRIFAKSCYSTSVVFAWSAPDGDPAKNQPQASVVFHSALLDGPTASVLLALSVGGALLSLIGGLVWARARPPTGAPGDEQGTAEALRRSLDRMGAQLERTRRHLLFAGVLGVFLWYPILVPWTWRSARALTDDPLVPWALAAAALAFLVVLTILWAREFLRLDRELNAWRGRMSELRVREESLLDSFERDEGR